MLSAILFLEDSREDALRTVAGKTLHAPFILGSEIASVALKKGRAGCPDAVIQDALDQYGQHDVELHDAGQGGAPTSPGPSRVIPAQAGTHGVQPHARIPPRRALRHCHFVNTQRARAA